MTDCRNKPANNITGDPTEDPVKKKFRTYSERISMDIPSHDSHIEDSIEFYPHYTIVAEIHDEKHTGLDKRPYMKTVTTYSKLVIHA